MTVVPKLITLSSHM